MPKHARLSPSSSVRWGNCPASVVFDDKLRQEHGGELPDVSSPAAVNGSLAHAYAELRLRALFYPDPGELRRVEADAAEAALDPKTLENVEVYIEAVSDIVQTYQMDAIAWGVEGEFNLWYEPDSHGTADFWMVVKASRTLYILDYKSGWVSVNPARNTQLIIYAIAAYDEMSRFYDIDNVICAISQPARSHALLEWGFGVDELDHYRDQINRAVREINEPIMTPRFVPGEKQCQWCLHRPVCPAIKDELFPLLGAAEEPIETLSDKDVFEVVDKLGLLRGYLDSVEEHVRSLSAEALEKYGWKLVRGNRRFSWVDKDNEIANILDNLGVAPYVEKLKTPAQARKELGDDAQLAGLYKTSFNKPLLVSADDRRPSLGTEKE